MRISELASATGVPVPTIKYYLREGLLPEGERTSATQARYDESHARRLRLIRTLVGHVGLSIAETRALLGVLDSPPPGAHDLLGFAHDAVSRPASASPDALERTRALLASAGWPTGSLHDEPIAAIANALERMTDAGFEMPPALLAEYLAAARRIAAAEIAHVPTDSAEAAVRYVTVGVVLAEPLLLALRRAAEQLESAEHFGGAGLGGDQGPTQ